MSIFKPEFVDNRSGNTMARALREHLDTVRDTYAAPISVSIASGYFNPEGFALVAESLEATAGVRLLIGAEPTPPPAIPVRHPGDPKGEQFNLRILKRALALEDEGMARDRDMLDFDEETDGRVCRLLAYLRSGRIEVRRYTRGFLHGKAYIFADNEGCIVGSSNFTAAGLTTNLELNLGRYDPAPVEQVKRWFDDLWELAEPFDLAAMYEARYAEYPPYLIYLRVLWERYGHELSDEAHGGPIRLTTFQEDGIWRTERILEKRHGALVCDGVGLGKTFVGGEILRRTIYEKRQRALLISPASLRDGTWARFLDRFSIKVECLSFEELAMDIQLGGTQTKLLHDRNEYSLVLIDEAHALRNPDADRSRALRRLLEGEPPKDVIMMTATPVNNTLFDLYYLMMFFARHDAAFSDIGITSLKDHFRDAMNEDPNELRPDRLFDVLDACTVRRTRHFVKKFYPNERVTGPDGAMMTISFPDPHLNVVNYDIDELMPGFFNEFEAALTPPPDEDEQAEAAAAGVAPDPADALPRLTMARYQPAKFMLEGNRRGGGDDEGEGGGVAASQAALAGLLRSALLKRFESSVIAFQSTARRMIASHIAFLTALERGFIATPEVIEAWSPEAINDQREFDRLMNGLERLLDESGAEPADMYDTDALRQAVEADRSLLERLLSMTTDVTRDKDPKLRALLDYMAEAAAAARKDAVTAEDEVNKRKIIIFTSFEDTVEWIEAYLKDAVARDPRLSCYRGRIACTVGHSVRDGLTREDALFGFAPISTEAPAHRRDDRFDILISTDVLAEGQNLQQCRNLLHYDLCWNPMRLVQRQGRIDRIGSPHRDIYVGCYFPDRRMDEILELEQRIRDKVARAAATVGMEFEVIPGAATADRNFAETREQIDALRRHDAALIIEGGETATAYSGEEYRQELRHAMDDHGHQVKSLPWAAGSGFRGGRQRGVFFCARVGERVFLRFAPADGSEMITDTLGCLSRIVCRPETERYIDPELYARVYENWRAARESIHEDWMRLTDPANLQPRIRRAFRLAAEHLRNHPPADMPQDAVDRVVDALEAPWGVRVEKTIREIVNSDASPEAISRRLIEEVRSLGLQPYKAPEPLPEIEPDEIHLICWMAVAG